MDKKRWPNRIHEWRAHSGLSVRDIAKRAGISHGQVQKLENGTRPLTLDHMRKLARVFDIKPSALLNDDDVECRLDATEEGFILEIRRADIEPEIVLIGVRALLRAVKDMRSSTHLREALAGDPDIASELAEAWSALDHPQRVRALELVKMSRGFHSATAAA